MTIDFFFIKDILFMNSILILMFFKKAPQKTGVLIISLVKIFINEKKKKIGWKFIIIWPQNR